MGCPWKAKVVIKNEVHAYIYFLLKDMCGAVWCGAEKRECEYMKEGKEEC
jgi:hypothetical protein